MACTKSRPIELVPPDSTYSGRIGFILEYNSAEFSSLVSSLAPPVTIDSLNAPGPITFFAYNNNAPFLSLGFVPQNYLLPADVSLRFTRPGQSSSYFTASGYKISISSYAIGPDTVYGANGALVLNTDQHASNGELQVLGREMFIKYYPSPLSAINDDQSLSIFAYAIQRSHLDTLLNDSTAAYTVFAPTNGSMISAGYTLDSISREDPARLAQELVRYHILAGRYFMLDFDTQGNSTGPVTLTVATLNGQQLQVLISPACFTDPNSNTPQLVGNSNTNPVNLVAQDNPYSGVGFDIPAGAGTVQIIDNLLLP